ncbi:MAG: ABC transporter permease/M1 family aminopeptidase [Flavobacteriaceae bacterium]
MFKQFFISELRYNLRQPMVYLFFTIVFLLVFAANSTDNVQIGGAIGNVNRNAPHVITVFTTVMCIFGLLFAVAFFNNAALRDHKYNFQDILFATPLNKFGYFFGRFTAALLLSTIPLLGVFFGIVLGSYIAPLAGWIEPDRFGPIKLSTFLSNYFIFVLPNMLFAGSIIYLLAQRFRSTIVSFIGALIIIIAYSVSGNYLSDLDNETLGALVDTFGNRTYSIVSKYYTPLEKNTLNPSFSGLMLWNRLIWIGFSLGLLIFSYFSFRFSDRKTMVKKKEVKADIPTKIAAVKPKSIHIEESIVGQFFSFFSLNIKSIYKHVTFRILFLFSVILLLTDLISGFEYYGLQSYPLTYKMTDAIDGTTLFIMIILVFFSGELIWRDRDTNINEVIDATPHITLIPLFAKTLSLFCLTLLLHTFFVFITVTYQLIMGYFQIELSTYFWDFIYNSFPLYLVTCIMLVAVQVLINNKYLGYMFSVIIILGLDIILSIADIQTNMLRFMGTPYLIYSDMNGFGPSKEGVFWFSLYWFVSALFLLMISGRFWARGSASSFKERFNSRLAKPNPIYNLFLAITGILWFAIASFVYYNTQVLNPYKTGDEAEQLAIDYEKTYKKYKGMPHPKVIKANYTIDISPSKRSATVVSKIKLVNPYDRPIDTLLFNVNTQREEVYDFPNAKLVKEDSKHKVHFYLFDPPFEKGDTMVANVSMHFAPKGFSNGGASTSIVENGTFLNNFQVLPSIGYNEEKELSDRNKRKKFKLPPKDRMPALEENCSEKCFKNYLTDGYSDYIDVETVISTEKGQIAVAPGSMVEQWEENDRNYYRYIVDHPSQNFYSFISADYEISKRDWNGIAIEIYHDAKHGVNVEKMLDAVERSLAYYTENFGPYTHKQCRIIEFPRFSTFAQAFPGTMPYSEAFGFVIDLEDEEKNNVIDAVIAHEMAHQWWAHQLVGANMQGGTLLSESFSEYSSLMTMKSIAKSPMEMREFLKYDHDRYLRGRATELEKELPLYKVENQSYIHYGKGSVILYSLQDYIGEEKVNAAMSEFLVAHKYKTPYPTSLDFLSYLEPKVPDSLNYLIDDWFKEITLYDNRLLSAQAKKLENGKYTVTLEIEARKIKADSIGNEQEVAVNDWIDVGVFADSEEKILMHQQRVKLTHAKSQVVLEVDSLPAKAGVDPRHILIDRVFDDNIKTVKLD